MFDILSDWRNLESKAFNLFKKLPKLEEEREEFREEIKLIEELYNKSDELFYSYILEEDVNKNSLILEFSKIYIKLKEMKMDLNASKADSSFLEIKSFIDGAPLKQCSLQRKTSEDLYLTEEYINSIENLKCKLKRKTVKPGVKSSKSKFYNTKVKSLMKEILNLLPLLEELRIPQDCKISDLSTSENLVNLVSDASSLRSSAHFRLLHDYKGLKSLMLKSTEMLITKPNIILESPELVPASILLEDSFLVLDDPDMTMNKNFSDISGSTRALTPKDLFFLNHRSKLKASSVYVADSQNSDLKHIEGDKVFAFDSQAVKTDFNYVKQKGKKSSILEIIPHESISDKKCVNCQIF